MKAIGSVALLAAVPLASALIGCAPMAMQESGEGIHAGNLRLNGELNVHWREDQRQFPPLDEIEGTGPLVRSALPSSVVVAIPEPIVTEYGEGSLSLPAWWEMPLFIPDPGLFGFGDAFHRHGRHDHAGHHVEPPPKSVQASPAMDSRSEYVRQAIAHTVPREGAAYEGGSWTAYDTAPVYRERFPSSPLRNPTIDHGVGHGPHIAHVSEAHFGAHRHRR